MLISFTSEVPKDLSILMEFEQQHPEELRWGVQLKIANADNLFSHYIYMRSNEHIVGELILGWYDDDWVNVDSFTVLPEYQGKGLGKILLDKALEWAKDYGFTEIRATSKQPVSTNVFVKAGFEVTDIDTDWYGTKLTYAHVKKTL
jgi:GNAT superfamily N-acetyltransferase